MNAPTSESSTRKPPKPRRRWFQFSLRTLMLMMLVFGCGLGWLAYEWTKNAKGQADIATIRDLGGVVQFNGSLPISPAWLQWLLGNDSFRNVYKVSLPSSEISDAGMEHLEGLTQLQCLYLSGTAISDAGLEHVKRLTRIESLDLSCTAITDTGLEHLKELTQLRYLWLYDTEITDDGLEHLRGLDKLEELSLGNTKITDAGLEHLSRLTQLKKLFLYNTNITDAGQSDFKTALPNCTIRK